MGGGRRLPSAIDVTATGKEMTIGGYGKVVRFNSERMGNRKRSTKRVIDLALFCDRQVDRIGWIKLFCTLNEGLGFRVKQLTVFGRIGHSSQWKRLRRNGVGSTQVSSPQTICAISFPAPGPRPNPWPENPVAMKKLGNSSTADITGTTSGVTSITPAQRSAIWASVNAGSACCRDVSATFWMPECGCGSRMRTCSNGSPRRCSTAASAALRRQNAGQCEIESRAIRFLKLARNQATDGNCLV